MQYTQLGRTGLKVSQLCLGTMNFGPQTIEADAFAIMDRALELGINFFDTANVYGGQRGEGITEQIIGRWLAQGGGRPAREDRAGDQGLRRDGRVAQRIAAIGLPHPRGVRCELAPHANRPHRPISDAPHRARGALAGDLAGDGGVGAAGQGALRRQQQLRRLAHRTGAGRGADAQLHGPGLGTEPLQPERAHDRVGGRPGLPRVRPGHHPWSPLGGGLLGGVLGGAAVAGARPSASSRPSRSIARSWRRGRRSAPSWARSRPTWRWPGCCTTRSSPRRSSAHARSSSSMAACARSRSRCRMTPCSGST